MKKLIVLPLFLLLVFVAAAQSLKPVANMVRQAKESGSNFYNSSLFSDQFSDLSRFPQITDAVKEGLVLDWDASAVAKLREHAGQPVTFTLPLSTDQTIVLDMVPAKNFSDDFKVILASSGQRAQNIDKGVHYWGTVQDDPASLVCISVFDQEVIGLIVTGNERYAIGAIPNRQDKKHILFRESDLRMPEVFNCHTDDELHKIVAEEAVAERVANPDNCVRMYVETDYTVFQNKGSVANVTTYMTGVFSQVSALYTNESVNLNLHTLYVWDVNDPYAGPSASNYLTQFRDAKNGVFDGDLGHLVGIHNLGGVAYLDVLCNGFYSVGYSSINATYSNVPTYSWTIEVLTHEIGHNLGSSHTHACVWNGNNTAIDGCGPTAGYSEGCTAALPTNGGTIMSYCHLVSGVGINFNNGFGPQPGDRIRTEVYNAPCLTTCGGGGGGCSYVSINSQNFDAGWGIWTDGGTDCARINNATYANSPTFSIQLRDNTSTSVTTTTSQNWTTYDEITVAFSYITVSFENGEDFWVQLSTNGGTSYSTKASYAAGTSFTNGVRQNVSVVIPGPFTSTTRLRFRADASADDDQVYIDDVVITGCQQQFGETPSDRILNSEHTILSNIWAGPNPTSGDYHVMFNAATEAPVSIYVSDLAGRLMHTSRYQALKGDNRYQVPVADFTNGVYFVRVQVGADVFTTKMVMSR